MWEQYVVESGGGTFRGGYNCSYILIICQRVSVWEWMTNWEEGDWNGAFYLSQNICVVDHECPVPIPFLGRCSLSPSVSLLASNGLYLPALLENCFQQTEATCLEIPRRLCPPSAPEATWSWLMTDGHRVQKLGSFPQAEQPSGSIHILELPMGSGGGSASAESLYSITSALDLPCFSPCSWEFSLNEAPVPESPSQALLLGNSA